MKLKGILTFAVALVIMLSLVITGCVPTVNSEKVTGGGWIEQPDGSKVTFGFNAQPIDDYQMAKGQFQLVDYGDKPPTRLHGSFVLPRRVPEGTENQKALYVGECSVNGEEGFWFVISVQDLGEPGFGAGDDILVAVGEVIDGEPVGPACYFYEGVLGGGNIQVHKAKDNGGG